jgi:glycosyltransferase involved in cell wall biosynthesis
LKPRIPGDLRSSGASGSRLPDVKDGVTPTLCVVIPTRNRTELLARCLDRLSPGVQSVAPDRYAVIVSDDGDGNGTRDLIAAKYPWARWVVGPRRGPAANRNAGARLSEAPYLVFADDDCIPDRDWLDGFLPAIDRGCDLSPGRIVSREAWHSPLEHAPLNESGDAVWSCNMLVRREFFVRMGGFDERFPHAHMEDLDFQTRARALAPIEVFSSRAVVDHPPRRLAWGSSLAATHYSEVLFASLHGTSVSLPGMLRRIAGARWRAIKGHPMSGDTILAFGSLAAELSHVVRHWREWRVQAAKAAGQGR